MKKNLLLKFVFIFLSLNLNAQVQDGAIDDAGDIAFVAFHDNDDGFAWVFLDDCPIGASIRFVDEGWVGTEFNSASSEGEVLWTNSSGSIISSGTVVTITDADDNSSGISASVGSASEVDSGFTTGTVVEQIYAITGTRAAPGVFLAAIGNLDIDGSINITLSGTGLVDGATANNIGDGEGYYTGGTDCVGSATTCASNINSNLNWTIGGFSFPAAVPSSFSNTTTPAPNNAPTFTNLSGSVEVTNEDTATEITFAEIEAQGNETDSDGTVDAFVVKSVTSGSLMINGAAFATGTNDEITATKSASWTPALNANGTLNAFTITAKDDDDDESASPVQATVNVAAVNDEPSFAKGSDQVVNEDVGAQTVNGWATSLEDGDADATQTLTFNVSNDNNGLFSTQPSIDASGNLTYTPATNANGSATVTVSISDNGGTANGGDDTSADQTFTITVNSVNDEPSFTKGANQVVNEDAGAQTVNSWATNISVGPVDESTQTSSFVVVNNNNGLFATQPAIDSSGNLTYTPAANTLGVTVVSVVMTDNGGTANGGDDTFTTQQFTITVNSVNDVPSFTKGANQVVNEDAGAQTINGWATNINDGDGEAIQTLTFNVSNDNNALFSVQPDIDETTGNLTYTSAANAFGSATVTVSLSDNGGTANGGDDTSANQTFTITVNSVNDEPSFIKGEDQLVNEGSGAQTVNGWATGLSDGDGDTQNLTFTVVNNNNSLFSSQPAIDASGNLTYTLAAGLNGVAVVSVVLTDDGGTANGGDDTFTTQQFTITVNESTLSIDKISIDLNNTEVVNPVKEELIVTGSLEITSITIYDLSGALVADSTEVSGLVPGIYVVVIETTEGVITKKIIKE